jgi:hypothetical protein
MRALVDAGVRERVVVHFPEGGCALDRDGTWHEHGSVSLPTRYIKGACRRGRRVYRRYVTLAGTKGRPVREALRLGMCAAAANLSDETCTGGLRSREECPRPWRAAWLSALDILSETQLFSIRNFCGSFAT